MSDTSYLIVVPIRLESKRLPNKAIREFDEKPLFIKTLERISDGITKEKILVATDSDAIIAYCKQYGFSSFKSETKHDCGTSRVAEVAKFRQEIKYFVNWQSDEIGNFSAATLEAIKSDNIEILTFASPSKDKSEIQNPNRVKTVLDSKGNALYFSRAPIPWSRDEECCEESLIHNGIYLFRRDILLKYPDLEKPLAEKKEKLEQLRWLHNGFNIKVKSVKTDGFQIDTEEDLEKVRKQKQSYGH